jgi:YebC/PmpR family DNA-binding regulatory protein
MSGHNKWSSIKHKKAKEDSKRGAIFTKVIKEITIAAREGGGAPEANPRLRMAIEKAKEANMPKQNIEKAIKKGTGELPGTTYEDVTYEGYGPGGVAMIIETTTDNRQRTTASVRHLLSKYGGSLGENGCVSWMFNYVGYIAFEKNSTDEESLFEAALEAGASDVKESEDGLLFEVITDVKNFISVKEALENQGFKPVEAELTKIPQNTVKLDGDKATSMLKLMDALEDDEDISNVYANFDIPDEIIEKFS